MKKKTFSKFALLLAAGLTSAAHTHTAFADGHEKLSDQAKKVAEKAGEVTAKLTALLQARSEEDRQRDQYRHPAETLAFFQVEPGMTVAEGLPGGGWYSKILAGYLGGDATLYGVNYADDMWARFGFFDEEGIKEQIALTEQFNQTVKNATDNGISTKGFTFATVPDEVLGTVDRVLFIRALHNLNRFETAGTLTQALEAAHNMLKDGGMVGVVQHRIPEDAGADDGSRGYLKESRVKQMFAGAGFEFVASSEINANPKDQPGNEDIVWRLPPFLFKVGDDEAKKAAMMAIGESDRMTMLFKKVAKAESE